jgi:tRNA(Ile2) C34 agmatinyltransferase TiaS
MDTSRSGPAKISGEESMSAGERTIKCPICGNPYKAYSFYAGDQSACKSCINKADSKQNKNELDRAIDRINEIRNIKK